MDSVTIRIRDKGYTDSTFCDLVAKPVHIVCNDLRGLFSSILPPAHLMFEILRGATEWDFDNILDDNSNAAAASWIDAGSNAPHRVNLLFHLGAAADSCQSKQAQVLICPHSPAAHSGHILTMNVALAHQIERGFWCVLYLL